MVDEKISVQERIDSADRLRAETDEILATSAMLIAQVEALLERSRQLGLAREALLAQRRAIRKS